MLISLKFEPRVTGVPIMLIERWFVDHEKSLFPPDEPFGSVVDSWNIYYSSNGFYLPKKKNENRDFSLN